MGTYNDIINQIFSTTPTPNGNILTKQVSVRGTSTGRNLPPSTALATPPGNAPNSAPRAAGGAPARQDLAPNSFSHNTTQNAPATSATTSTSNPYNSAPKIEFLPNDLDRYDVYTYHWKFFTVSLQNALNGTVLDPKVQVVIAESGVTELTIDKVEIRGVAIPSVEAGTGTQTTIKFEIIEPAGAKLLDQMFYESASLDVGSWTTTPYYMELQFRGRSPNTSNSDTNGLPAMGQTKWVWPMKLSTVKANVNEVGTRYDFEAILYDEVAQSNAYFSFPHNVTISNIKTVQTALADLENKINADQREMLLTSYSVPDVYKIIVDPAFANEPIKLGKTDSSRYGSFEVFDEKSANYAANTSIDKIIDSILGNTDYFQEKMQSSTTPDAPPATILEEKNKMKSLWRIVTECRPYQYDPLRQQNANYITIFVIQYDIGVMDVTASQTGQTADSLPAEKARFNEYISKSILRKIYNYIFTGLNDQVINFDLNLNAAFASAKSRFDGLYYDSSTQINNSQVNNVNKEDKERIQEQIRQSIQFINNAGVSPAQQAEKIDQTSAAIQASQLDSATKTTYQTILQQSKPADRATLFAAGSTAGQSYTQTLAQSKSLAQPSTDFVPAFISDIVLNKTNIEAAQAVIRTTGKGKLRPIPFLESNTDNNLGYGFDPSGSPGRNRLSSIFSTALYSGVDANLQSVKLTIKGDPFWLFPGPVQDNSPLLSNTFIAATNGVQAAIDNIKLSSVKKNSVNIYGTDNFAIIRFRTPNTFQRTAGQDTPFTEVETFSGIYRVTVITSKFEGGMFTQELECVLDPVIRLSNFLDEVDKAIEISQGAPTPAPLPTPSSVPTSYSKEPRIQGDATEVIVPGTSVTPKFLSNTYVASGTQSIGNVIKPASNIPTISSTNPLSTFDLPGTSQV